MCSRGWFHCREKGNTCCITHRKYTICIVSVCDVNMAHQRQKILYRENCNHRSGSTGITLHKFVYFIYIYIYIYIASKTDSTCKYSLENIVLPFVACVSSSSVTLPLFCGQVLCKSLLSGPAGHIPPTHH